MGAGVISFLVVVMDATVKEGWLTVSPAHNRSRGWSARSRLIDSGNGGSAGMLEQL